MRDFNIARNPSASVKARELIHSQPMLCEALEEAFEAGGCVLCHVLHQFEKRSLFSFLYDGMMTPEARQDFVQAGGFCARHFRLAVQISRSEHLGLLGLAMLCRQLVPQAESVAAEAGAQRPRRRRLGRPKDPDRIPAHGCVFCRDLRINEEQLIRTLETLVDDEEFSARLSRNALCSEHVQLMLAHWENASKRQWIAAVLRRHASELVHDLKEFQRKHDYRFSHEPYGREINIVERCMEFLLGLESKADSGSPTEQPKYERKKA
ncbi:MAG: DUF6062 family protein [Terriglobales bacterium]